MMSETSAEQLRTFLFLHNVLKVCS